MCSTSTHHMFHRVLNFYDFQQTEINFTHTPVEIPNHPDFDPNDLGIFRFVITIYHIESF